MEAGSKRIFTLFFAGDQKAPEAAVHYNEDPICEKIVWKDLLGSKMGFST